MNCPTLHMSGAQLPLSRASSASWVWRTYRWFRSFDFKNMSLGKMSMKNCFTSLVKITAKVTGFVNYYRDWLDEIFGITNYQDIGIPLDSGPQLKKRIEELENILNEAEKSHALSLPSNSAQTANKTRSSTKGSTAPTERKIFGRDIARDDIIKKLNEGLDGNAPNSSSSKCYSVIGICGIAGSGKTTLARHVYDRIKQDGRFDSTMFIHVSGTFTLEDIFRDMLKGILKLDNIGDCEEVQVMLEKGLRGKRFFLVLDDLWVQGDNNEKLKKLLSLDAAMKGSKILVTSRSNDVARSLCADEPIAIPDLHEADYLAMFMHHALDGSGADDRLFRPVGRKIAAKLLRSPIAAVTVGGQLRKRPYVNFWETTATLDVLNETRGALWWSYQLLDADTRRCFEYCTIFPRRFELKKEEIVRLWLAQGFVKTSDATEDMEDVAEDCFQDLVACSFLQQPSDYVVDMVDIFTIHDLLHDLAERVTGSDCFRIEKNGPRWTGDVPRDVCHLFIENYDASLITEKILELEHLHSLIICSVGGRVTVEENVIENIFKKLLKLRVLAVPFEEARTGELCPFSIPESISQLKHLRYLAFMGSTLRVILPTTLNKLYHIQLLKFGCTEKLEFPHADLINLRDVFCNKGVQFGNIGRLISLQTMVHFRVQNKQGHEVKQLRNLNKLRTFLTISGLENVKSKEEALESNLAAKERIRVLQLTWDDGDMSINQGVEADVFEGLCPPVDLQTLNIFNYKGSRYPSWMVCRQSNGPKNLNHLWLSGWNQPGPSPKLEAFIHLRHLQLSNCSWNVLPGNMEHLTSLARLIISRCMNIWLLPTLPQSLEYIELNACNAEFLKSCGTPGHPNWHKILHVPYKLIYSYGWGQPRKPTPRTWMSVSLASPETLAIRRQRRKYFKAVRRRDV